MAELYLKPGVLNITKVFGDGLSVDLDFSIPLTDYTFEASVVNAVTKAETTITVSIVDLSAGQIKLAMSEAVAAGIPVGKHTWALRWTEPGKPKRTVLAGAFEVIS